MNKILRKARGRDRLCRIVSVRKRTSRGKKSMQPKNYMPLVSLAAQPCTARAIISAGEPRSTALQKGLCKSADSSAIGPKACMTQERTVASVFRLFGACKSREGEIVISFESL